MRNAVELRGVTKHFGAVVALDNVSLAVEQGEFVTLLGPSGCGKTTLLRLIAGFESADRGTVHLADENVTAVPAYRRNVNQVFQSYALFPHLTVRENIAFGLRMQRLSRDAIDARISETVALVSLEGYEARMPHELSGGQRQRVGLARAIAPRPAVLLLDEPLSALDAQLRQTMQLELKRLQRRLGMTFVFVTHDQEEALALSDRVALLRTGRIEQVGTPHEIYHRPATQFAAEFIGATNVLEAELISRVDDTAHVRVLGFPVEFQLPARGWPKDALRARLSIRPEKIPLSRNAVPGGNTFEVRVEESAFKGALDQLVVSLVGGKRLTVLASTGGSSRGTLEPGDRVWATVNPDDVVILPSPSRDDGRVASAK